MLAWLLAVVLVVIGIVQLLQGDLLWAIVFFVAAALVGPGGYSIFRNRRTV
ncbi:MAG TPA: GPGG-motif small membrane protein [Acidimicrobiia bacterium]|nr:GPGG-motif small membrane protein [Acidimicrobiia bacterium]